MALTQVPASMLDTGTQNLVLQQVRYETGTMATGTEWGEVLAGFFYGLTFMLAEVIFK